jgi:hypothetical protein
LKDLQTEISAIEKICTQNHRNIVNVLRNNPLPNSPYYYIDMQLCDINLDDYIYKAKSWPAALVGTRPFFRPDPPQYVPMEWVILVDIVNGLVFIQSLGCVHPSDLKPRNGRI